jgi:hypothetical protein
MHCFNYFHYFSLRARHGRAQQSQVLKKAIASFIRNDLHRSSVPGGAGMINHVRLRSPIFAFALFTMVSALNSRAVADDHSHPQSAAMPQSAESAQFQKEMDAGMGKMMSDMHAAGYSGNADADFLEMMIPHHEGAVEMARLELIYGRDPLTRKLAEDIIAGQQVEIEAMKRRLAILRNKHELGKEEFPPLGGTRGKSGQGSDSKIKPEK